MFKYIYHSSYSQTFTIGDTDFTETISDKNKTGWHATIEVYSKRNLNVWSNLALSFIQFCNECHCNDNDKLVLLDYIENDLKINTDNLKKYLMLV